MLFHALLLLVHGEKAFAPAATPGRVMPRANAPLAPQKTIQIQQVAMPPTQPVFEERSSTVTMAANLLMVSGLATLAAGAGLAMRSPAPSERTTELTEALTVDAELGQAQRNVSRVSTIKMASVADTLASADGPEIFWGPDGPLQNPMKEESDFKEFDKFDLFLDACAANGVDLNQPDITVFAPSNRACEQFSAVSGPLTADVCAYHIVKGKVPVASLSSTPLTTVQGGTITYRRMFRKDFVDNAFCGVKADPPRSSYAANLKADNGIIHGINEVIYPGWSESSGGYGSEGDPAATRA